MKLISSNVSEQNFIFNDDEASSNYNSKSTEIPEVEKAQIESKIVLYLNFE